MGLFFRYNSGKVKIIHRNEGKLRQSWIKIMILLQKTGKGKEQ